MLDARRKRRIAAGSGTKVEEINKLVKMHRQMADMMKTMGRNKGMLNKLVGGGGGRGTDRSRDGGRCRTSLRSSIPRRSSSCRKNFEDAAAKGMPTKGIPGSRRRHDAEAPAALARGCPDWAAACRNSPGLPGKKK